MYAFWAYQFNCCTINIHFKSTLILGIPLALIVLMYQLSKKEKLNSSFALTITIISIVLFLILNFFIFIFLIWDEGTAYENNPLRYRHIYSIAGYKSLTYQFPKKIPQESLKNDTVRFFYSPQFLQGAFRLELLQEMEIQDINDYINNYKDKVKEVIEVNDENKSRLYREYGISEIHKVFDRGEYKEFMNGGTIYLLESESYKPNDWNHGYVAYIAKNEKLKKLLIVTQVW